MVKLAAMPVNPPQAATKIRALSLLSGGLDSQLAVCVLRAQGIEVETVAFESPFFNPEAPRAAAAQLHVPLHLVDFSADIMALLNDPPHGFGRCMNPCIDCHARMLKRAGQMMEERGFHFLSTGEVLNERPMSQNRTSLAVVARESGYGDLIVRPLSAGLLPPTKPEQVGWVDRARLLSIEGRSRKPQTELAQRYGLTHYPQPAGGCLLTEPLFCARLQELKEHEGLRDLHALKLLRYGRHFRLAADLKLIVGRNQSDNALLERHAGPADLVLKVAEIPGPTALLPCTATAEQVCLAAAICARYSDTAPNRPATILIHSPRGEQRLEATPAQPNEVEAIRI